VQQEDVRAVSAVIAYRELDPVVRGNEEIGQSPPR
jgi:hypothetical protein